MCNKSCQPCSQEKTLESIIQVSKRLKLTPDDPEAISRLMATVDVYMNEHLKKCMGRI